MSYVLVPVSKAKSSQEVRQYVMDTLSDDPTFVGEKGRFATPVCDWFVIGGRWSGRLYPKKLRDTFYQQVRRVLDKENPYMLDPSFIEENRETLDIIWEKLGGKYDSLLTRDPGCVLGGEDDACLLDNRLAEELNFYLYDTDGHSVEGCYIAKSVWWKPVRVISLDNDLDLLCELDTFHQVVGEHWVVVVDYHF